MPASQSRLQKLVKSIQNTFGFHVCIKRKSSAGKNIDAEKLLNIFTELTIGISEVFDGEKRSFEEFLRCDRVSCKINVLNEQISHVRVLHSLWKSGFDLDPQEITTKCQSLNLIVDCIRDDVFYAYLRMPPEQKVELLKKNKQVSTIFAVLGSLENEVTEMVKTMLPGGEFMKVVRPLLRPAFNRVVYRKCTQNVFNYCTPDSYQTLNICYKEPSMVDASTDPIDQAEWQHALVEYKMPIQNGSMIECKKEDFASDYHQPQLNISAQPPHQFFVAGIASRWWDKKFSKWEYDVTEGQSISETINASDGMGTFTAKSDESWDYPTVENYIEQQEYHSTCFQGLSAGSKKNKIDPQTFEMNGSRVNLWKMAADMIVENPVLE